MKDRLGEEWYELLKDEFSKAYMQSLQSLIARRRQTTNVYPASFDVFNAYKLTPYSKVKVCIIGQDPYINPGEAHGLAFSTYTGKSTPSLEKMSKAVLNSLGLTHSEYYWSNNLTRWTEQGIFLLNKVLTVDAGKSASHTGLGWENFTLKTIQELDKKGNVIFLLWGSSAQEYDKYITKGINTVIKCEHPVYASRQKRDWIFNDCFNETNKILRDLGEKEIIW